MSASVLELKDVSIGPLPESRQHTIIFLSTNGAYNILVRVRRVGRVAQVFGVLSHPFDRYLWYIASFSRDVFEPLRNARTATWQIKQRSMYKSSQD